MPGNEIKKRVTNDGYKADLDSSEERLNQWKDGKVSAAERRILFTKWLGDAWEDYSTNCQEEITNAFKKAGMYNDIHGRENHLIKVTMMPEYVAPKKDDPLPDLPKKKAKKRRAPAARRSRKKERKSRKKLKKSKWVKRDWGP